MTIAGLDWVVHRQPVKDAGWALITGRVAAVDCVIVTLTTTDGTVGRGVISSLPPFDPPLAAIEAVLRAFVPLVVGRAAGEIGPVVDALDRRQHGFSSVKAGIEIALTELAARRRGCSIAAMLGGVAVPRLPVLRIVPLLAPEATADFAGGLAGRGYRTLKVKLGGDEAIDLRRVAAVRTRVGDAVALTVDANGSYDAKGALRLASGLAELGVVLFEQPVAAADRDGLALVTRSTTMIVEADESAASLSDIAALLRDRAVDSINLRIADLGGIRPVLRAIAMCEAAGIGWRFGACFLPSQHQAVTAHVAAAFVRPRGVAHELAEHELFDGDPFGPLPVENGEIVLPGGAGSGIDLEGASPPAACRPPIARSS